MVRRLVLGLVLVGPALPAPAWANGRLPQLVNLYVRPGAPAELLGTATFGPIVSTDSGDTWRWMCETAVGYSGTYDPDYAVTPTGAIVATTFDGLKIKRPDSCVWDLTPLGDTNVMTVTVASDGTLHAAISFVGNPLANPPIPADYKLYRSTDDGVSFNAGTVVDPMGGETWISLEAAPSDPGIVYLTGYRFRSGLPKELLVYRSDDAGQTWSPRTATGFTTTDRSDLEVVAISPTDPDRVLLRVTWWDRVIGDELYLTTNGGTSWTSVLRLPNFGFGVFRISGDAVVATPGSGVFRSIDGGATFLPVPPPGPDPDAAMMVHPDIYCLRENPAGELLACTSQYTQPPFDYALMKTTDLATWTGVMRFRDDILGPLECPIGTLQEDCCNHHTSACPMQNTPTWCAIAAQLGVVVPECLVPDAGPIVEEPKTCCGAADPTGTGLLVLVVVAGLSRGHRRGR